MSGNTNPNQSGSPELLVGDFTSLSPRAQAVVSSLSGITIGQTVTLGSDTEILFVSGGAPPILDQDPRLTYNLSTNVLTINGIHRALVIEPLPAQNLFFRVASGFAAFIEIAKRAITHTGFAKTIIRPAQIVANQNDYNPSANNGGFSFFVNSDAARSITGFVWSNDSGSAAIQTEGLSVEIINNGAFNITLVHQSAASVAGNRFLNSTGADIVLSPNQAADLIYDDTADRWRVFKRN